tara:strand:+ start:2164 stop:2859 length:696 start_codon:yes stop_codon:yes gene_type:complete
MKPIMTISGSEPRLIKEKLASISIIDETMIYPDYKIFSKFGYTVGISRATTNDLVSNKSDVISHVAEELDKIKDDVRIFLMEDWLGKDRHGKVSLPGGQYVNRDYKAVINQVMSACLATGTLWVPSASLTATAELLMQWNNEYFQKEKHSSLSIRPRKAERVFSLDEEQGDKVWWLSDIPNLGIGKERAEAMLEASGNTLLSLFIKTKEELQQIKGVGANIADRFVRFLNT